MGFSCSNLQVNDDVCGANYTPSRDRCGVGAFVLHALPTFTTESYLAFTREPFLFSRDYYTPYPRSVHFLISENATIYQLVETYDRAWGISELDDPSWPLLNQCPYTDHEDLFIHIGFIGATCSNAQLDAAALLMCCLVVEDGNQINIGCDDTGIIVARDLDIKLDALWSVPGNILAKTQICVQNKGVDPYFLDDLGTYGGRISDLEDWRCVVDPKLSQLEDCCCENQVAIKKLEDDLADAQAELAGINVSSLEQRIDTIETGNFEIWKAIRVIQNCLECADICIPETPVSIKYRLDLTSTVKLVPGSIQHLNLPQKINDTNPPIVTTGPLWHAELLEEAQTLCTTFKIKGTVRLSSASFCAGRSLELYAILNSENILLNKYTADAGEQSAFVFGETIFTVPPDSVVYLGVKTDEDSVPLEIAMASVEITCLDGLLSPNCVECDTV